MKTEVNIIHTEQQVIYGLRKKSNDKTISEDITTLSERYYSIISLPKGRVLPYYVLSRNYDRQSGDFEMLVGGEVNKNGLECFILPAGEYAKITVRPKFGFLWGLSIGAAKRFFYTKWLQESQYEALNMEYEYHTERSVAKSPTVDIIFAIRRKQ